MAKRNPIVVILLMPIALCLWLLGWGLYSAGNRQKKAKPKIIQAQRRDHLSFTIAIPEEEPYIINKAHH